MKALATRGITAAIILALAVAGSSSLAGAAAKDPTFSTTNLQAVAGSEEAGSVNVTVTWDSPVYPATATGDRAGGVRVQRCLETGCAGAWTGVVQTPPATDANPQVTSTCPSTAAACTFRVQPYYFKAYCRYWQLADTYYASISERYANAVCGKWGNRLVLGAWTTTSVSPWPTPTGP